MSGAEEVMNPGENTTDPDQRLSQDWWRTEIIDMRPGEIRYRGYPIEQLIGRVSFAQMICSRPVDASAGWDVISRS
ncbi:hypothetical protein CNE_BB2p01600 (plasmid) [Cupriavidus necator N-1]|uniref:Citrate synthase n=1 Tax=Cupriavidus necator (strain ATCC 43291 / DSM 13513 / CCUG 52238 / LMG 8453 / N-1) TaxID=1042878 RepID=F8GYN0_CUPNN|nr:hypothetical protein [Cupriavidus necator]AEI82971.1 hypothetical protein CNE_BB2p01600 [Cupriavidus necator N-1]MDX6008758.1 hypothetical protein [Cupriavidus necator]